MLRALLAPLALTSVLGCAATGFPVSVPLRDASLEQSWRSQLFVPSSAITCQARAVLRNRGSELDFTLLVRRAENELRLVALTDLGGTLFHVLATEGGTLVIQGSPFLPEAYLERVLVEGLRPVFVGCAPAAFALERLESGELALRGTCGGSQILITGATPPGAPSLYLVGREDGLVARLTVCEWAREGELRPVRLTVADPGERASLEVRVLEWKEGSTP